MALNGCGSRPVAEPAAPAGEDQMHPPWTWAATDFIPTTLLDELMTLIVKEEKSAPCQDARKFQQKIFPQSTCSAQPPRDLADAQPHRKLYKFHCI